MSTNFVRTAVRKRVAFVLTVALVSVPAVMRHAEARPHKDGDLARAHALDKEGARAYGDGRYEEAIRYFEEAYRLGGPSFELWNIAKCHLRLDRPDRAAALLERYLESPNLPKEDREEASQQLELLRKRPSTLTVTSTPTGAQVALDGLNLDGRTPLVVTVPPGAHTIAVTAPAYPPVIRRVEARHGQALVVDAPLATEAHRPPPPPNPYAAPEGGPLTLRGAFGVVLPRHGTIGGETRAGWMALATYRVTSIGRTAISAGGLATVTGDGWANRTGAPNVTEGCGGPLTDAESATALSVFGVLSAAYPVAKRIRLVGLGGAGGAMYFVGDLGGDLFRPSCPASPMVTPAAFLGSQLDFSVTSRLKLSVFPLTWHVQPAFEGARSAPRDASGIWMRFGSAIGAGVDL